MALQGSVLIADDHPLFRMALKQAVIQAFPRTDIIEAENIERLEQIIEQKPDLSLLLLDLNMPGAYGFTGLIYLRQKCLNTPVIVISADNEAATVYKAMEYGAAGFIPKSESVETMMSAIEQVCSGRSWLPPYLLTHPAPLLVETESDLVSRIESLTPQQFRVLGMLAEGQLNKQIAFALNVAEATVKAHMTAIFRKLGVRNRTQAVIQLRKLETRPSENG